MTSLAFLPLLTSLALTKIAIIESTTAGGNDFSNNTHIRVIGPMEPEICTKMLKKLSEKLRAKFNATAHGYSIAKIARLDDALLEVFSCEQAQWKVNHCSKKKRKGEKGKAKKNLKIEKPKRRRPLSHPKTQNFDFCVSPSQNVIKCDARGKKGKLSCCKCYYPA